MAIKLTQDAQTFLDGLLDRNRAIYGDLRMEANGGGGNGDGGGDGDEAGTGQSGDGGEGDGDEPKPSETLDYWKKRSRENERRAKDNDKRAKENAAAAKRLAEIEAESKTAEERQTEAVERQKAETEALRVENLRLKAAGTHGVTGEDAEGVAYSDLISGTDEESVAKSAEAIGRLVAAANELAAMKDGRNGHPGTGRPTRIGTKAGATPAGTPKAGGAGGISEAERRFGAPAQN